MRCKKNDISDENRERFQIFMISLNSIINTNNNQRNLLSRTDRIWYAYMAAAELFPILEEKDVSPKWFYDDFKKFSKQYSSILDGTTLYKKYISIFNIRYQRNHPWG